MITICSPVTVIQGAITTCTEENKPAAAEADFVTGAAIRETGETHMIAALRHADCRLRGKGGAAASFGIEPAADASDEGVQDW